MMSENDTTSVSAFNPSNDFQPMSVDNTGFLLDKLHQDCSPLQFLRELTQNSIESIKALDDPHGEIHWDVDWLRYDTTKIFKLSITDNGIGMTGQEMVKYINHLSSSIHKQSADGNYGVGAKISAIPLNPEGLIYMSWKDGQGHMIQIKQNDKGEYGLVRFDTGEYWIPINDNLKHRVIKEHGTMVVLLGKDEYDDTMSAPPGSSNPAGWVMRYLNSKYYEISDGIKLNVRISWGKDRENTRHNFLRNIKGSKDWLNKKAKSCGSLRLENSKATVHWWLAKEDADTDSGEHTPSGYVAALYKDEIYNIPQKRRHTHLLAFGIVFGWKRIVLYVEPDINMCSVSTDIARTKIKVDGDDIEWTMFSTEFYENMPEELRDFQDSFLQQNGNEDIKKNISKRLRDIEELLKFKKFSTKSDGAKSLEKDSKDTLSETNNGIAPEFGTENDVEEEDEASHKQKSKRTPKKDLYARLAESGIPAEENEARIREPEVQWLEQDDFGDDRHAARYERTTNTLVINEGFFVFTNMEDRWTKEFGEVARKQVKRRVQEWFQQQLVETVMSILALKKPLKMSESDENDLLSSSALTASVLARYHIDMSIKRSLGADIRKSESGEQDDE